MASFSDRAMLCIWLEVADSAGDEDGQGVVSLTGPAGLMALDVCESETVKLDNKLANCREEWLVKELHQCVHDHINALIPH
jgi:hypothetical protein